MDILSVEIDIRGMTHGVCELLWIPRVLIELGFNYMNLMMLQCDNKVIISIAYNLAQHDHTKHVEIHHHFIKEKLYLKPI